MLRIAQTLLPWVAVACVVLASLVVLAYGLRGLAHNYREIAFTPSAWARADTSRCVCGRMLKSLTSNHLHIGKVKRAETITLLGTDFGRSGRNCIVYDLGLCNVIDPAWLELCFGNANRLISSRRIVG